METSQRSWEEKSGAGYHMTQGVQWSFYGKMEPHMSLCFIGKNNLSDCLSFVGLLMGEMCLNNGFKSSGESF